MAADIPTVEPTKHQAGTTLLFSRSLPDFPANTWTLTYELRSHVNAPLSFTASANGTAHSVDVSFSTTADWNSGDYLMTGYVTDGTQRHQVYQSKIEITPYSATEGTYEWRSYAVRMLALIEDTIAGRVARSDVSYSINGRSFTPKSDEDLLKVRDYFRAEVNQEKSAGRNRKILVRFINPR